MIEPQTIPFDYLGAINSGGSIADAESSMKEDHGIDFDVNGALGAGHSHEDIHNYIQSVPPEDGVTKEMRLLSGRKMNYDNNTPLQIIKNASAQTKINPALLYSSAFQEGMNKAIVHPDEVSEAYLNAKVDSKKFPVDGFYNYGLDTFGGNMDKLKKYLPEGFSSKVQTYKAKNEKGEWVTTAAFQNNQDALTAKAAMMQDSIDSIKDYAKKKNITLDDKAINYFTLAAYNGGLGNARAMLDEYSKQKDKQGYIDKGLTSKKQIHKNISPRLQRMELADKLLKNTNE